MGQAKNNPTALAAKRGELPPKPVPISKSELQRSLYMEIRKKMVDKLGLPIISQY